MSTSFGLSCQMNQLLLPNSCFPSQTLQPLSGYARAVESVESTASRPTIRGHCKNRRHRCRFQSSRHQISPQATRGGTTHFPLSIKIDWLFHPAPCKSLPRVQTDRSPQGRSLEIYQEIVSLWLHHRRTPRRNCVRSSLS